MKKLKVVTILGTRPELIRLSLLIPKLDETFHHIFVHTGQNYDATLRDVFFQDFNLRDPDYNLNVDVTSLGSILGDTLKKIEPIFVEEKPDAVLVLGDTNSAIAALIAKRMHIPVYHLEAGNRSFDENVPEEVNRRMLDHIADFNLPYNSYSYQNLRDEGIHPRRILKTGSPMPEVFATFQSKIDASKILKTLNLERGKYFLVSAHRQENIDNRERLILLLDTLKSIYEHFKLPIVVSTHPRTRSKLNELNGSESIEGVQFHEPFGFFDYNSLQLNALVVISDSGTVSEESCILGFPAVTIRESIERPEALETGGIITTGLSKDEVFQGINRVIGQTAKPFSVPDGYEVRDFSERVVRYLLSTATKSNKWSGIRSY